MSTDPMLDLSGRRPPAASDMAVGGGAPPMSLLAEGTPAGEVFSSVLYYCSLILFLPLVSFFATKTVVLEAVMGVEKDSVTSNVTSAMVAVVVLHLALGLFIYKAYFQQDQPKVRLGKQE